MTWLDLLCGLFLLLVGIGGYAQGFIRGGLRLLALLVGSALGLLFTMRLGSLATATAAVVWAGAAAMLGITVAALAAWSLAKALPNVVHRALTNRLLGILPAVVLGLVILVIGLGLVDRLTTSSATQELLRKGLVTGPLVGAGDLIEQMIAGVR